MWLNKLGASTRGYITIQAEGIFLERFLNICARRGLTLSNIHRPGEERLICDMSVSSFRKIRPVCFRTKTRVKILKRIGLPFLLYRYRKRKFALFGILLATLFLWYTTGHIMGITILGNEKISTETILQSLARVQVAPGKSSRNLVPSHIRNQVMQDLDELAWIGINIRGSRVFVEVVERLTAEKRVEKETPCHLVASRDGVITSILAKEGQTMVSVGSGVRHGDVLISGIMDNTVSGYRSVHAYGEVYAQTFYETSKDYPLKFIHQEDTGNTKRRYTLRILGKELPLYVRKSAPYPAFETKVLEKEYRIPLDFLPSLFVKKEEFLEQSSREENRTVSDVLHLAKEELTTALMQEIPENAEILEETLSHNLTEHGVVQVTLTIQCRENIAREVPINREENSASNEEV